MPSSPKRVTLFMVAALFWTLAVSVLAGRLICYLAVLCPPQQNAEEFGWLSLSLGFMSIALGLLGLGLAQTANRLGKQGLRAQFLNNAREVFRLRRPISIDHDVSWIAWDLAETARSAGRFLDNAEPEDRRMFILDACLAFRFMMTRWQASVGLRGVKPDVRTFLTDESTHPVRFEDVRHCLVCLEEAAKAPEAEEQVDGVGIRSILNDFLDVEVDQPDYSSLSALVEKLRAAASLAKKLTFGFHGIPPQGIQGRPNLDPSKYHDQFDLDLYKHLVRDIFPAIRFEPDNEAAPGLEPSENRALRAS